MPDHGEHTRFRWIHIYIYHIMLVFCLMTKKDGDDGKKKYLVEKKRCLMEEIGMKTQNKILYF